MHKPVVKANFSEKTVQCQTDWPTKTIISLDSGPG